jgi:uncharacterized delta-60 repeat protein
MKKLLSRVLVLIITLLPHLAQAQQPCALDPAWDADGRLLADVSRLGEHIVVQPDGKVLVGCNPFGDSYAYIRRYNTDGSIDSTYGANGKFDVEVAERRTDIKDMVLHNGTLYLCGSTVTNIGAIDTIVYAAAIETNGGWKNTFGTGGVKRFDSGNTDFYGVAGIGVDANGKVYLAGLARHDNLFVVRINTSGVLDNSWDGDGVAFVATNNIDHWWEVQDIDFDKTGKVLVAGKKYKASNSSAIPLFWNVMIARFNSNGSLDGSFANGGIGLYSSGSMHLDEGKQIQVTAANDYVVIGNTFEGIDHDFSVVKVRNNGVLDPAFGNAGWAIHDLNANNETDYCLAGALLPDGRMLLTGNHEAGDTVYFASLMLDANGVRDQAFAVDGYFLDVFDHHNSNRCGGLALTSDGKVYLGGYARTCINGTCGPMHMAVSRYVGGSPAVGSSNAIALQLKLYPNPAQSGRQIYLQAIDADEVISLTLTDLSGRVLQIDPTKSSFVLPDLASGIYICRLQTEAGVAFGRLLVE